MKRLLFLLPAALLFGAGCSLLPGVPTTPIRPLPAIPVGPPPSAPPNVPAPKPVTQATGTQATTFTDTQYSFKIAYPSAATLATKNAATDTTYLLGDFMQPRLSVTGEGMTHPLYISVWKTRDAAECATTSTGSATLSEQKTLNGVTFSIGRWGDAGAGGLWEGTIYRTYHDGNCFDLEYTIESHSDGSPEYQAKRAALERAGAAFFDPIIASFTFVK